MAREIEIKAAVEDLSAVRERLTELGAERTHERAFEDNYLLADSAGSLGRRLMTVGEVMRPLASRFGWDYHRKFVEKVWL